MQKNFNVPEKLKEYFFSIIHEHLVNSKKIEDENNLVLIKNKIYDYTMSKINSKIFPQDYDDDDKLYKNEIMLSWIKPENLLKGKKDYILDIFLPDITKFFDSFENECSPRKKIENIDNIFNFVSQVIEFNEGKKILGVDDQFSPLCYCFVKAKKSKFLSNLKFIQIYRNSLNEKGNENKLVQLSIACNFIMNIKYNDLYEITLEEFVKNCNEKNNPVLD